MSPDIFYGASMAGNETLCRMVMASNIIDRDFLAKAAGKGGHENICNMIYSDPANIIRAAARAGHAELCKSMLKRAINYDWWWNVLYGAVEKNNLQMLVRVHDTMPASASGWTSLMRRTTTTGNKYLCELVFYWLIGQMTRRTWYYANLMGCSEQMLYHAAGEGYEELCYLAKSYGSTHFDSMLAAAARSGHTRICHLAKKWGSSVWIHDGSGYELPRNDDVRALLTEWLCDDQPKLITKKRKLK
jgi:hypothetical protein